MIPKPTPVSVTLVVLPETVAFGNQAFVNQALKKAMARSSILLRGTGFNGL